MDKLLIMSTQQTFVNCYSHTGFIVVHRGDIFDSRAVGIATGFIPHHSWTVLQILKFKDAQQSLAYLSILQS